jgi:hypothetical protein
MSRKLWTVAAVAAFALPLATANAQKLGFGASAGLAAPMGDFGDIAQSGYNLTGLVTLSAPLAPISGRAEVSYAAFSGKGFASGINQTMTSGTVNAVVSTPGMMGLYAIGGLGMYKPGCDNGCTAADAKIGFNGGAGYKMGLAGFSAFVEARYHTVSFSGGSTNWIPVVFGITF